MKNNAHLFVILLPVVLLIATSCRGAAVPEQSRVTSSAETRPFMDPKRPIDERVADLIGRMTLPEKVSQMTHDSPGIDRLGVPAYNWWNECLHGVARAGRATVFPQAIGMAATFNEDLIFEVSSAISDEARAMYQAAIDKDRRLRYGGLTFWTPNINIFRDPRWGRGQETYGEDPYLTSVIGTAFVRGLQGDDPRYLKTAACAKHYAVHSGPEALRHEFDAQVSLKDMYETYLPAFKALVDADVEAVMCAYNRTNGEPCCGSKTLLHKILREQWGFAGHILSDCWAIVDFYQGHNVVETPAQAAALAVNSGVSLDCGNSFPHLVDAVRQGLVTEQAIDEVLAILLRTRFKLGMFDPPGMNPYSKISTDVIRSKEHQQLARKAAVESIVLLKNANDVLPLQKDAKRLYVTGPCAANVEVLLGNYFGVSDNLVTILEGITGKLEPGSFAGYTQGFLLDRENVNPIDWTSGDAKEADAMIVVMGYSPQLEGEEGAAIASPHKGDRQDIGLPPNQVNFLRRLRQGNTKPIIVVLTGGSPVAIPEVHELADAILYVWYPGEQGGVAVADVIFGDVSPAGRLPLTFPKSTDQLPPYDDYSMVGRTYRYMTAEPLYPFGFGLSYSRFEYSDLKLDNTQPRQGETVRATVTVRNVGNVAGDEVVQLYLTDVEASVRTPISALKGFRRVHLKPAQRREVAFMITPEMMSLVDENGDSRLEPGQFRVTIGGCSPGKRGTDLGASKPVQATFAVR
ncbi:glycoside hydrolase family 3 C-terminal domain-containing protein [Anaerobaca lacustris]|uniref:Glycoside hydrolase family 3 C-terminal domain-containing protein n=1 Tax=Anaerobaca lacustris TaxID=3044600 RepID=A0AAW6TWD5_9BACT|nr:glycoside hydrolase family 3 C-terminal domain-containing protein [Sedimentisphaerales bacterium M17dextr]